MVVCVFVNQQTEKLGGRERERVWTEWVIIVIQSTTPLCYDGEEEEDGITVVAVVCCFAVSRKTRCDVSAKDESPLR
jgi:hypothetical protein